MQNLIPVKPGQVLNPTGKNQYSYQSDAEKHLDEWCREYGRELIVKLCDEAREGNAVALKIVIDRILPIVHHVEVAPTVPAESPAYVPSESDQAEIEQRLVGTGVVH